MGPAGNTFGVKSTFIIDEHSSCEWVSSLNISKGIVIPNIPNIPSESYIVQHAFLIRYRNSPRLFMSAE